MPTVIKGAFEDQERVKKYIQTNAFLIDVSRLFMVSIRRYRTIEYACMFFLNFVYKLKKKVVI